LEGDRCSQNRRFPNSTDVTSVDALVWEATAYSRFRASVLSVLALFAVGLAVTGILGVVSHAVVARTREIGIRGAIGARPIQLVVLIMRDMASATALGVAAGLVATRALSHWLSRFLGGPELGPAPYVTAALALIVVSALASWLPARRAARIDPILALRAE
jgi:ABC-type antimicrobial peptide transport system permease subunit